MNKKTLIGVTFCLALSLSMGRRANAGSAPTEDLEKAEWSVNARHNLESNPPPLSAVQAFLSAVGGRLEDPSLIQICDFSFADFHHSGDLSLVYSFGRYCNQTDIFDKTATSFEEYTIDAAPEKGSLRKSIQDIKHDGKLELILWAPLTGQSDIAPECDWPMVFAWNGNTYAEVSDQYKQYYEGYLSSLKKQMAAIYSRGKQAQAPAVATPQAPPTTNYQGPGVEVGSSRVQPPYPAPSPEAPSDSDIECDRVEAAKTEQFLGIHSDATMIAAIKDSESNDLYDRRLAAVLFSFIGTQEAKADLKALANDSDPDVASVAKDRLSDGLRPIENYRQVVSYSIKWPPAKH